MSSFLKILVPTDFSAHAEEAFRVAQDLAKARGSGVVVFHMCRPATVVSDGETVSPEFDGGRPRDAWDELRKIQATDPAVRVEHELIVTAKPSAKHILRLLDERGCDLIVMGTRSKRIWKRLRLGSVTQAVVRRAQSRVILVTAPANVAEEPVNPCIDQLASRV
jgi:nucleotide-binding universal stress UspA family protein